ncbi:cytokinin dehydrogenase 1-like [Amaranthus tricolor]|uniref:cytokinin dehydrogenase 1-like n=1 Tax=Amaranthus tricolor TaxID=29722 RepID=UPI00258A1917|nr:cytokinin dehydrogenase 1-like [Amaranthus tricolor]
MESLEEPRFFVHIGEDPYVDALGGELWINVLYESIKYGLAPKSWTDFLYLSVGGTLSNGGISGEAFKHGPQINSSNVYQLEVVTGKGDLVNCSEKENADLFYGVLGGLGQFGIITKARISLQVAPKLVKWIKVLYSEFNLFTKDQENLIALHDTFDYIEGFVLTNVENNMTSNSSGKTLYGLEVAKFFNPHEKNITNKKIDEILGKLNYLSHTFLESQVTYVEFLDRLHVLPELMVEDRSNVANVSFPWLNLLVPKSSILTFGEEVFTHILSNITYSPLLIYPFNQSRWKDKTSMVTPEEDVIYLVSFLTSAKTYSSGLDGLQNMLTINKKILDFVNKESLGVKQYLPYHDALEEWQAHFGKRWDVFSRRKKSYDPLSILSPKQRIFQRGQIIL